MEKENINAVSEDLKESVDNVQENLESIDKNIDDAVSQEDTRQDINNEQVDEKQLKIERLEEEVSQMKDLAQRTQAEFMNYKKRVTKEKQDITVFANEKILTELLSVLDNFGRAIEAEQDKESHFYKGVELINKELETVLNKNGLEEIPALGEEFDHNLHHAVVQEDSDEPNKVLEVLQKGYKLKDKVIRPSMVKVSR